VAEIVLVTSRGTAHAGVNRDGTVMTFEACNLDQSRCHVADGLTDPRIKRRCRRCFPVKP